MRNSEFSILIVDDVSENLQLLGNMLSKEGYAVEFALNGPKALDWVTSHTFDLVLLDIMMPGMSGFEVCTRIQQTMGSKAPVIIFLTAKADQDSLVKGLRLGAVDYVSKPFNMLELQARIHTQVRLKEAERSAMGLMKELKQKEKNLTDSIKYAHTIQKALLPTDKMMQQLFSQCFVYHKPKAIVSGDFYWANRVADKTVLVVADSTGHGVPGAFMSLLGIAFLNDIVLKDGIIEPAAIFNRLRTCLLEAFGSSGSNTEELVLDGIEGTVLVLDHKNSLLQYTTANASFLLANSHGIHQKKATDMPVGYQTKMTQFEQFSCELSLGDRLFLYSDGCYDQFGGPLGKKLGSEQFAKQLHSTQELSLSEQGASMQHFLKTWQGANPQLDDILLLGIQF